MKILKSLKEFENESNVMTSNELKNISGGSNHQFTIVTGKNGGDRQPMCQQMHLEGNTWIMDGPAYTTGPAYNWP